MNRRRLRVAIIPSGQRMFHACFFRHGYDSFNPGLGRSRFAPIADGHGHSVATLYLAEDEGVALLESVFHEVTPSGERVIRERDLRVRGLAHVAPPAPLRLVDLRDSALTELGIERAGLVTTRAAHYPCTQEWAAWFHTNGVRGREVDGLLWHSRMAELVPDEPRPEVAVIFGDRVTSLPGSFRLVGPGVRNLLEGPGRVLVDEIAERLDVLI
ncbi:MAG TPA: RES family NAD+ phosphorylase, partial [Acidimicrobiales bacterium]|nr:RES family NAD+ phosphorylase [Acidimicrobiales bacterium]